MKLLQAILILSGMIIGVGMFGIPFSFMQAGFWLGMLELVIIAGVVTALHLLYGEIVLHTGPLHRLPGYIKVHLGDRASLIAWGSALFGIIGTLLAYIVLGSLFLGHLLAAVGIDGTGIAVWVMVTSGAAITFIPLKRGVLINGALTAVLIGLLVFLVIELAPGIRPEKLEGFFPAQFFAPYGVLLFALSGGVVIPDLITFLGKERHRARRAIALGTLIPAALYGVFALAVVGVAGTGVSEDAIQGLLPFAGSRVVLLGNLIGFLAVFTSYIVLGASFQALLRIDFRLPRLSAWFAASAAPLLLYLLGFNSFLPIIGAVGAGAVGVDGTLLVIAYHRMQQERGVRRALPGLVGEIVLAVTILAGVGYTLYSFLAS